MLSHIKSNVLSGKYLRKTNEINKFKQQIRIVISHNGVIGKVYIFKLTK